MYVEIKDGKLMFKSTLESQDRIEMTIACWAERERKCGIGLKIQGRNAASALLRINSVLKMQHISWHELCHGGFENYGWVCIQLTKLKILCWNATLGWAGIEIENSWVEMQHWAGTEIEILCWNAALGQAGIEKLKLNWKLSVEMQHWAELEVAGWISVLLCYCSGDRLYYQLLAMHGSCCIALGCFKLHKLHNIAHCS